MPLLFSPRMTTPSLRTKSLPGIQVPGNANTDFMPVTALGAPHTTSISVPVPHPNSDHLKVCKVDAGTGTLIDVVCGAPNAETGMKSVFALPGTYIPGKDFVLKEGVVIRGQ